MKYSSIGYPIRFVMLSGTVWSIIRWSNITLFLGVKYPAPVILGPVGVQGIVHGDAEIASARAASTCGIPFTLSTAATRTIEDVAKEGGEGPKWFQLYWPKVNCRHSYLKRTEERAAHLPPLSHGIFRPRMSASHSSLEPRLAATK